MIYYRVVLRGSSSQVALEVIPTVIPTPLTPVPPTPVPPTPVPPTPVPPTPVRSGLSCVNPSSVTIDPVNIGDPRIMSKTVTLCTFGRGTVSWSVSWSASWLSLSTSSGQIQAPQTQTITVSASARGLQINTDTTTVTFRDDQSDPPLTLSVRFSVLAPCLNVNTTSLYFDPTKANPQYVTLTNCSARENWTASIQYQDGNSGWLSITPGYGTLEAGASQVLTVSVSVSYPMSGIYHATIYLIDGSYETSISVTLSTSSPHG